MFLIGHTVQLKSGGPTMTVTESYGDDVYRCQWFDDKAKMQTSPFPRESLVEVVIQEKVTQGLLPDNFTGVDDERETSELHNRKDADLIV